MLNFATEVVAASFIEIDVVMSMEIRISFLSHLLPLNHICPFVAPIYKQMKSHTSHNVHYAALCGKLLMPTQKV